jgi:ribosomal protein L37AE/L43A
MNPEYKKDNCPYCGKEVLIRLNVPFFGDQRICAECQQRMSGSFDIKEARTP